MIIFVKNKIQYLWKLLIRTYKNGKLGHHPPWKSSIIWFFRRMNIHIINGLNANWRPKFIGKLNQVSFLLDVYWKGDTTTLFALEGLRILWISVDDEVSWICFMAMLEKGTWLIRFLNFLVWWLPGLKMNLPWFWVFDMIMLCGDSVLQRVH